MLRRRNKKKVCWFIVNTLQDTDPLEFRRLAFDIFYDIRKITGGHTVVFNVNSERVGETELARGRELGKTIKNYKTRKRLLVVGRIPMPFFGTTHVLCGKL